MGEGGSEPASEPATLVDSLPSVSTVRFFEDLSRCRSDLARADFERLWLEVGERLAVFIGSGGRSWSLIHRDGEACREAHLSAPLSDIFGSDQLTLLLECRIEGIHVQQIEARSRGSLPLIQPRAERPCSLGGSPGLCSGRVIFKVFLSSHPRSFLLV